ATLWARGVELFRDAPTWVPYELVHTNFSLPLPAGSGTFLMSSNGLASGNHRLEAISHGLCELIERDCMALFAANGGVTQHGRRLDLASVDDPDGCRVIAQLQAADLSVGLWDVTSDVGLAAFACVIVDRTPNVFRQLYYATGSGCHPLRRVALTRALTEAAQCRLTYIAGARDDADRDFFERARDPERVQRMRRIVDDTSAPGRPYSHVPDRSHERLEDDVSWELACLERAGLREVVVVDLSKPELDIPVVRVIVPGLESLQGAPGYTPGRRAQAAPLQLPRTDGGVGGVA
ncbi:MAG: YcaO-like family protein, partial [Polyangiales bacterium]